MVRKKREDQKFEESFDVGMRNSAMEFDALDADASRTLEFDEFSKLVRERELGVHSEDALRERFEAISDGEGHVTMASYMMNAIRDAFGRAATGAEDVIAAWDEDENGEIDAGEVRAHTPIKQ